jgi:predicted aspartyl protease
VRAGCRIERRGEAVLDTSRGVPVVPAMANGTEAAFVLDTGAARSVLDEAAVRRLSLPLDEWAAMTMRGVGGAVRHRVAHLRSLSVGGAGLHRRSAAGDMSMAVVPVLPFAGEPPVSGLLGGDYLQTYDLAWEPADKRLALFAVQGCNGRFVPGASAYDALVAEPSSAGWLVVRVTLEDRMVRALIDSGAERSLLTRAGAARLGLLTHGAGGPTLGGIGPGPVGAERRIFTDMRVGSEAIRPARLLVAGDLVIPGIDLVLGADWLLPRHVWLSYATGQVFVRRP